MTKDLKRLGEIEFNDRKKEVDSLYLKIQDDLGQEEKESVMKLFASKRDELDQFNQTFAINETEKATIRLNLLSKKEQIIFSIENTKPQNEFARISDKSKIGLMNVRKQLDLLYPTKHQLEIEETQTNYTVKLYLTI